MNKYELKDKIKSIKKSTWLWWGFSTFMVLVGIALGITGMYLSGYTLVTWLEKFYPWVIVGVGVVVVIVTSVLLAKYRKGR